MDIRLSQCMIVKNEEANIEQALSWGKDICLEQIVVDTGSTDNTVAIAKQLGAKVFHFGWIEDFAAAKNYAIGQASGDWIAFLDADEYFQEEDARKIIPMIKKILTYPKKKRPCIIGSGILHLNDEKDIFSTGRQTRIFSRHDVQYEGKIHETLVRVDGEPVILWDAYEDLSVYHTGYAAESYKRAGKLERNISMIQKVLEETPDNYDYWSYLGDSLLADKQNDKAEQAYRKVIESGDSSIAPSRFDMAYANLMRICAAKKKEDILSSVVDLYARYTSIGGACPDVDYWAGIAMHRLDEKEKAIGYLENGLRNLETYQSDLPLQISGSLKDVYVMLAKFYYALYQKADCVRYAVLALRMDAYLDGVLSVVLKLLQEEKGEAENPAGTYNFLSKLYNMNSLKDLIFIFKCAKISDFQKMADLIYDTLPKDVQDQLTLS